MEVLQKPLSASCCKVKKHKGLTQAITHLCSRHYTTAPDIQLDGIELTPIEIATSLDALVVPQGFKAILTADINDGILIDGIGTRIVLTEKVEVVAHRLVLNLLHNEVMGDDVEDYFGIGVRTLGTFLDELVSETAVPRDTVAREHFFLALRASF